MPAAVARRIPDLAQPRLPLPLRALNAIVASVGFYLLMRSYRTHPLSAVVGALIFSYGSFMAYEFVHIPYVNTAVWFP